jgi:hypothetical protein
MKVCRMRDGVSGEKEDAAPVRKFTEAASL